MSMTLNSIRLGILALALLAPAAFAGQKGPVRVAYGERAGMDATVVSRSGTDTEHASIRAKITPSDRRRYCRESSPRTPLSECLKWSPFFAGFREIVGDCTSGVFIDMDGRLLRFVGRDPNFGEASPWTTKYAIVQGVDSPPLQAYTVSGYDVAIGNFMALCPAAVKTAPVASSGPISGVAAFEWRDGRRLHARELSALLPACIGDDENFTKMRPSSQVAGLEECLTKAGLARVPDTNSGCAFVADHDFLNKDFIRIQCAWPEPQ